MIKERIKNFIRENIYCAPSEAMMEFMVKALRDESEEMPTFGRGRDSAIELYGQDRLGNEKARLRVPIERFGKPVELGYHVTLTRDGQRIVVREGAFERGEDLF